MTSLSPSLPPSLSLSLPLSPPLSLFPSLQYPSINAEQMDRILLNSNHLLLWMILLTLTILRLASSCLPFILLFFSLLFRTFIWDNILRSRISPTYFSSPLSPYIIGYTLCTVLSLLPVVLLVVFAIGISELFIPLMGRVGAIVSSDVLMSVVSGSVASLVFFSFVS